MHRTVQDDNATRTRAHSKEAISPKSNTNTNLISIRRNHVRGRRRLPKHTYYSVIRVVAKNHLARGNYLYASTNANLSLRVAQAKLCTYADPGVVSIKTCLITASAVRSVGCARASGWGESHPYSFFGNLYNKNESCARIFCHICLFNS
ncbi:hypothetical protein EVAR_32688_1 [Eumeta japonica]|uniref:Uncharacterized protein n=1 Tax=Eumeta variegata TaxID=151549 RepID=A0A4C1VS53_EUMVA|nr:hypothetical protein EVAR_32688_1 [Eumeta japonica]